MNQASIKIGARHRPDRPAVLPRHRQCQPGPPGGRRHQRRRRPARTPHRADHRRQRHRRQRGRRQGRQAGAARSRGRDLRRHLQLHPAGDQGPGRRAGQDALHLPGAVRGRGVRSADLLHRPRAGAAGRFADPVADEAYRCAQVLPAVGRLHLAARDEQARARRGHRAWRLDRRRGVLPARSHRLPRHRRATSCPAARRWSSTPRYRPAWRRSCSSCTRPVSRSAAAASSARTSRRTSPACCRPSMWRGSTAASTTIRP